VSASRTILGAGDVVAGFQIEDVIGIGGMAIVYRAEQTSLRRKVALKVLSPELNADPEFRERFRREGQHVAALDHPNVVAIYDSGETEDGRLYLAMRLVSGITLAQRMSETGVSADQAIGILMPIAHALDAAHGLGLVHRDVKPQNILLNEAGVPYLTDFGVARDASGGSGLTSTGSFVGSIHYAAPEQISGAAPTAAGDVYALTAVLYQCLTGQVPYPRDTEVAVMRAHLDEPPPAIPALPVEVARLNEVIARGMAKAPAERQARASQLVGDVSDILGVLPLWKRHNIPAFGAASAFDSAATEKTVTRDAGWARQGFAAPDDQVSSVTVRRAAIQPLAAPAVHDEEVAEMGAEGPAEIRAEEVAEVPTEAAAEVAALPVVVDSAAQVVALPAQDMPRSTPDRRRLALVGGAAAVIVAGAVGVVIAASGGGGKVAHKPPALLTAHSGPLEISYRHPWLPTTEAVFGVTRLTQPVVLKMGRAVLLAGPITTVAAVPGALPSNFFTPPPSGSATHLGAYLTESYDWSGSLLSGRAWIIPTTTGDIALICQATGGSSPALVDRCAAVAKTVVLSGATILPPGPDSALGKSLNAALAASATARTHLTGLGARKLQARGAAALTLSRADRKSVAAIRAIATPTRYTSVTTKIERALDREAVAFRGLARAAKTADRKSYSVERGRAARASRTVAGLSTALSPYGLALPTLAAIHVPKLPAVHKVHHAAPSSTPSSTPTTYTPPVSSSPSVNSTPPATHTPVKSTPTSKPKSGGGLVKAKPLK
jgi:hypothetical protein